MSDRFVMVIRCPKCRGRVRLSEEQAQALGDGTEQPITCASCSATFLPSGSAAPSPSEDLTEPSSGPNRAEPPFRGLIDPVQDSAELPPFGALDAPEPPNATATGNPVALWWQRTSQRRRKQLVAVGMIAILATGLLWPGPSQGNNIPDQRSAPLPPPPPPGDQPKAGPAPEIRLEPVLISRKEIAKNKPVTQATTREWFEIIYVDTPPRDALPVADELLSLYAQHPIPKGTIITKGMFGPEQKLPKSPARIHEQRVVDPQGVRIFWWVELPPSREVRARDFKDAERIVKEFDHQQLEAAETTHK